MIERLRGLRRATSYRLWSMSPRGRAGERAIRRLHGAYAGRRAFVIGNGPSLNKTEVERLAGEITIGCNSLFLLFPRMGFVPTFYTVEDQLVAEDRAREIAAITGTQKVFPYDLRRLIDDPGAVYLNFMREYQPFPRFSWDLARECFWGGTVTFFNLQLAAHLGCNPIVLVGVDHSYRTDVKVEREGNRWTSLGDDVNHFDPRYFGKGYRWHDPNVERMEASYRCAAAECNGRGISILNATAGGCLEVFPRVSFSSLFARAHS